MPRLLPKLRKALNASNRAGANAISLPEGLMSRKKRTRTMNRPLPTQPSLTGRTKSILLDDIKLMKRDRMNEFLYHKKLPPRVKVIKNGHESTPGEDLPREMTKEERSWYSSPWLRMLSSPMRQCVFTSKYLPSDFLVRLAAVRTKEPAEINSDLYILCRKSLIPLLAVRGLQYRIMQKRKVNLHSLLEQQIGWQLRERAIQEAEMLSERIRTTPIQNDWAGSEVVRRLSEGEWAVFGSGNGGFARNWLSDAAAVVVMPSSLSSTDSGSMKVQPIVEDDMASSTVKAKEGKTQKEINLSVASYLRPVTRHRKLDKVELDPHAMNVPVYNAQSLFHEEDQLNRFQVAIEDLLAADAQATRRRLTLGGGDKEVIVEDRSRWSAILVISSESSLKTADSVPFAIALWRLRMWEEGFASSNIGCRWLSN